MPPPPCPLAPPPCPLGPAPTSGLTIQGRMRVVLSVEAQGTTVGQRGRARLGRIGHRIYSDPMFLWGITLDANVAYPPPPPPSPSGLPPSLPCPPPPPPHSHHPSFLIALDTATPTSPPTPPAPCTLLSDPFPTLPHRHPLPSILSSRPSSPALSSLSSFHQDMF